MISGSVKYDPEPLEPVFMLRVVSRLVRPEFLVVIEIVAAKA